MPSSGLNEIINALQKHDKMNFLPLATEEQISDFETTQNVKLPSKYKEWLLFSDGGELYLPGGIQLYGVANKPLIDVNDSDKPNGDYIVIGALSSGDPIISEKAGERISIYNREADKIEEDETYSDFFAFLSDLDNIVGG